MFNDSNRSAVPTGRGSRLWSLGSVAGGSVAGGSVSGVPHATPLFLHRKFGGIYLLANKRRARVALRPMNKPYCHDQPLE